MHKRLLLILLYTLPFFAQSQEAEHLSSHINTASEEREPTLSPDGKRMYVWRRRHPQNMGGANDQGDIWVSHILPGGNFTQLQNAGRGLNSYGIDFVWQVSVTGDTLMTSQNLAGSNQGIRFAVKQPDGSWGKLQYLKIEGYTPAGPYKDFYITPQGHMMIPNAGEDLEGGVDLYVCFRINETTWGNPVNLGPDINTKGFEDAPFLLPDGKTLYFNSGETSDGQHDIYKSTRLDNTWQRWSPPEKVGAPINTPGYDADFVVSKDGEWGYWISDYTAYGGSKDIYRINLKDCKVHVYPQVNGDHVFCEGESLELEGGFVIGNDIRYQWLKDNYPLIGADKQQLTVKSSGAYRLIRHKAGCTDTSDVHRVRVTPSPEVTMETDSYIICSDEKINIKASSENIILWTWKKNGLIIPNENKSQIEIKNPGTYWVIARNGNCEAEARPIHIGRMKSPRIFPQNMAETRSKPRPSAWKWTTGFGKKNEKPILKDIASDPLGNTVVLGLVKQGKSFRECISMFDAEGKFLWKSDRNIAAENAKSFIKMDFEGNILVANSGDYLSKFNAQGRLLWKLEEKLQNISGLAIDPLGHVYTFGRFKGEMRIGTSTLKARKRGSAFIAKYDPAGKMLWLKTFSTEISRYDHGNALACDQSGNLYVSGGFDLIANFGKNQVLHGSIGVENYFLAKYKFDGNAEWCRKITTKRKTNKSSALFVDGNGNSFVFHNYKYVKYNTEGKEIWSARLQPPKGADARLVRIAVDEQGTLFTLGLTEIGNQYFLNRTDRRGKSLLIWKQKSTSKSNYEIPLICTNEEGKLFVAGQSKNAPSRQDYKGFATFISSFGQPNPERELDPLALCPGESVVLQLKLPRNISFYWLKDGTPIAGANDTLLTVTETGVYQVRAFNGSCERFSNQQAIEDCYQALSGTPKPRPKPQAESEPDKIKLPPKPEQAVVEAIAPKPISPPNMLKLAPNGLPKKLDGRRVSKQDHIVLSNPNIKISIWDHGGIDNDTVSVNVNGKVVLEHYALKRKAKVIELTLDPSGQNFIILYAHNLGNIPPNTATLKIEDGKYTHIIKLKSNLKSCGSLNVSFE